jgi:hypothetical protein
MPVTINASAHGTASLYASPITAGDTVTINISNTGFQESYFTLETIRNSLGRYDSTSPKTTSGSFTLTSGVFRLIQNDHFASVIVASGGGVLTFVPATNISANTLFIRGTGFK